MPQRVRLVGEANSMTLRRSAIAFAISIVAVFAGQVTGSRNALAARSPSAAASLSAASIEPRMTGTWVPWDGSQISTLDKCEARAAYLARTYHERFMCFSQSNPCGPGTYVVYVWRENGEAVLGVQRRTL